MYILPEFVRIKKYVVSPAKLPFGFRKGIFQKYSLKFDAKYSGKFYASILVISSGILRVQLACTVSRLADARCMLLWVCVTTMLEAVNKLLFALYCFKVMDVVLYLWDKWLHLFTKQRVRGLSALHCAR